MMVLRQDKGTEEGTVSVHDNNVLGARVTGPDGLTTEAGLNHAVSQGWAAVQRVMSITERAACVVS